MFTEIIVALRTNPGGWSLVGVDESDPPWGLNSTHFRNELFSGSDAVFAFDFQFNRKNSSRYQLVVS